MTYYGETKNRFRDLSDYRAAGKGGKFPNLHYAYRHFKSVLENCEAIFVRDETRIKNWKTARQRHNLPEILQSEQREFGREKFSLHAGYLTCALKYWAKMAAKISPPA